MTNTKAIDLQLWRVPVPLAHPVMTAVGLYDTYQHLVAVVRVGGHVGWGYSGVAGIGELELACRWVRERLPDGEVTLGSLMNIESKGTDTASRAAANAVSLAAWDLTARTMGVATGDLWGRLRDHDRQACYASGFFLDATIDELHAEAERYVADGHQLVKMRTGLTHVEDVARYRVIKEHFPAPGSIAVDAFHSWDADDANAFIGAVDGDLMWVEDATPYEQMAALCPSTAPLASGESLETRDDLVELVAKAHLDIALLDVQRLGGPRNWLSAARVLEAQGTQVGAHVYTPYSLHLLACVRDPRPVEVFDWSDALLANPARPDSEGRIAIEGVGFGVDLNWDLVRELGTRL